MRQIKFDRFFKEFLIGVGLGVVLYSHGDMKLKRNLKKSFEDLVNVVKDIDIEKTKALWIDKLSEIEKYFSSLNEDELNQKTNDFKNEIQMKCKELESLAKENSLPFLEEKINDFKTASINYLEDLQK